MSEFRQHTYTQVGTQRGVKRLWLQGLKLDECGFERGQRYRVEYDVDRNEISLVLCANGNRTVSGRKRGNRVDPIVDLCNADVVRFAGDATRVRADFKPGRIVFSISHLDLKRAEREGRFRQEVQDGSVTKASVCAGIGMASAALQEGLATAGVNSEVVWLADRSRRYLQVACDNNATVTPRTKLFEASLEELEPELLDPVSILQASLPCTGHSPAGKAKNKIADAEAHATDATAVFGLMKIVEAVQPAVIVSEQVIPGRNSATYTLIKSMLTVLDYVIHEVDLGPEQSGAMESRRRYWFVAVSKGLDALDLDTIPTFKRQYERLGDLLEPIADDDPSWSENEYLRKKQVRDKAAGKGFAQRQLLTAEATRIGTAGRGYQKRRSSEPFLTRDDGMERLLTPLELCRAHGAPESLIANTVDGVAYESLGQGIDWNQAAGIGMVIARDLCSARGNDVQVEPPDTDLVESDKQPNEGSQQLRMFA
jgi:DNA (cytosine-5)-methyltransferase 1